MPSFKQQSQEGECQLLHFHPVAMDYFLVIMQWNFFISFAISMAIMDYNGEIPHFNTFMLSVLLVIFGLFNVRSTIRNTQSIWIEIGSTHIYFTIKSILRSKTIQFTVFMGVISYIDDFRPHSLTLKNSTQNICKIGTFEDTEDKDRICQYLKEKCKQVRKQYLEALL